MILPRRQQTNLTRTGGGETRDSFCGCAARRFAAVIALLMAVSVVTAEAAQSGYGYSSNVEVRATVDSARRILDRNGGLFIGPDRVTQLFGTASGRLPYRLPFAERTIFDCLDRYGSCVLFPTVSRVGYRGVQTSLLALSRTPEARSVARIEANRLAPWFEDEPFARTPLKTVWHLVALNVRGRGIARTRQHLYHEHERIASAVLYYWMILLLPQDALTGQAFYARESVGRGDRNALVIGNPAPGRVRIHQVPRDINHTWIGVLPEIRPEH